MAIIFSWILDLATTPSGMYLVLGFSCREFIELLAEGQDPIGGQ